MSKTLVKLDITAEDIAFGRRGQANSCPIALALTRALGSSNHWYVSVGPKHRWEASSPRGDITIGGPLPVRTENFIHRWDDGKSVEPQQLKLWLGN